MLSTGRMHISTRTSMVSPSLCHGKSKFASTGPLPHIVSSKIPYPLLSPTLQSEWSLPECKQQQLSTPVRAGASILEQTGICVKTFPWREEKLNLRCLSLAKQVRGTPSLRKLKDPFVY